MPFLISIHAPREGSDNVRHMAYNIDTIFQSTLPVRGATSATQAAQAEFEISIHAPREGSDMHKALDYAAQVISIHAPREGSDHCAKDVKDALAISIHAPREGSDHTMHGHWP